ncbi:MAG: hybrid sensor histidine kinase/response regulator [Candidatus Ornithospirochaeta sp.]
MKRKKKEKVQKRVSLSIVLLIFLILFILYLVMAYMLFHSRTLASLEAGKSVIEKLYVVVERNNESIRDYNESLKDEFIIRASSVSYILENDESYENDTDKLKELAKILMVDEIHLFTPSGVIYGGTCPEYYGYSLYSGEQISFFIPMLSDTSLSLCQDISPNTAENKMMMYAMVWRSDQKGMVQVGVDPKRLAYELNANEVLSLVESMPVTQGRKLFVADKGSEIVIGATDSSYLGESLRAMGLDETEGEGLVQGIKKINDEYSFVSLYYGENFTLMVTQSLTNAYKNVWGAIIALFLFTVAVASILNTIIIIYNNKLSKERDERLKENEKKNKELSLALIDAEAASKSKSTFLMSMSHDLRTPMNAIIGYSDLLDKCTVDEEQRRYLNNIRVSGKQLMSLLDGVLSMTRIESGKIELDKESQELFSLFDEINVIIRERSDEKGLSFTYETQGEDCTLLLDKAKYSEILLNVLSNAVKYTKTGGKVVMRNSVIDNYDGTVVVTNVIEDNGIGMSPSFLPHIFETFERESMPGTGKEDGYGLGMSITKAFVDLMKGEISVESTQGVGTIVTISIPFKKTRKKEKKVESLDVVWSGKTALLVEDNDLNAEIAIIMLEDLGFTVERVEDGDKAVKMVEGREVPYDIVFMDILMPVMDGYEATKEIRNLKGQRSDVPIVAMTANAFKEDKVRAIACGMDAYVKKPLEKAAIIKAVSEVLGE